MTSFRAMCHQRLALGALVVFFIVPAGAFAAKRLPADPSGETLVAARKELVRLAEKAPRPSVFAGAERSVLERATLGEPFRYYSPDETIEWYAEAGSNNLLQYLGSITLCYPVYSDGRTLGTLDIQVLPDGTRSITRSVGEGLVQQYLARAESAPVQDGQRVSVVQPLIGEYAVVEDGTRILKMVRLNAPVGSKWLSPEEVAPLIKKEVVARREALRQVKEELNEHPLPGFEEHR